MEYLFGPVLSRRLGLSMGVDLLPPKTCNMDCNYCEIGRTTCLTVQRERYVPEKRVIREIRSISNCDFDYLTFAGSGEPTLHSGLGQIIRAARVSVDAPVVVITNSSLLSRPEVRDEVSNADLVLPSLDAATQKTFEAINRPAPGIRIEEIVEGLKQLRQNFSGEMWLEVMLVKGINDHEAPMIASLVDEINPDRVQLNTVVRPPSEPVEPLSQYEMLDMLEIFEGAEVIPDWNWHVPRDVEREIVDLLQDRPSTVVEIGEQLDLDMRDVMKYLKILERDERVMRQSSEGKLLFYV